jgi:hypothetical protein
MKEEIIKKLDKCRELRGLPKELSHRTKLLLFKMRKKI